MTEYLPLQQIYYRDSSSDRDASIRAEAQRRQNHESVFKTDIDIGSGELFLVIPTELAIINEKLLRVERKVSHLWRDLPEIARRAYLRGLILDEIAGTNEIEGIHTTRRQIEEALESVETREDKRFREFANLYLELTNKNNAYPKTPKDIRAIYNAVVAGELQEKDQPDGELFRKDSVSIMDSSQKQKHVGVVPESKIIDMLKQMISLVNSPNMPLLYAAVISHFVFEYIHPFYDGNGRIGRYLLALYLSEPLSLPTVLSLSGVIAENKSKYYNAFSITENPLNFAEVTFFVIAMLKLIRIAQDKVMEDLINKKMFLEMADDMLDDFREPPYSLSIKETAVLYQAVQQYWFGAFPEISLADIALYSEVSKQTARKYAYVLEEKGLLRSISLKPLKFKLTEQALAVFRIV